MSEDFLTPGRIRRLQVMGIAVWQERDKRASVVAAPAEPDIHSRSTPRPPQQRPTRLSSAQPAPSAERTTPPVSVAVPDAPRPDVDNYDWQKLRAAVSSCRACVLCETRQQTVFGVGDESADIMVIGEAPGAEEDKRGEPFVGRAGELLDTMLLSVGLKRSQVFISNVLKCRPPGNRDPHADEAAQCSAYLNRQIALVQPKVLVAVGRIAAQRLLATNASLARLRGKIHHYGDSRVPMVVTYHPAYLLRSPDQKRKTWEDLLMSQQLLKDKV